MMSIRVYGIFKVRAYSYTKLKNENKLHFLKWAYCKRRRLTNKQTKRDGISVFILMRYDKSSYFEEKSFRITI